MESQDASLSPQREKVALALAIVKLKPAEVNLRGRAPCPVSSNGLSTDQKLEIISSKYAATFGRDAASRPRVLCINTSIASLSGKTAAKELKQHRPSLDCALMNSKG